MNREVCVQLSCVVFRLDLQRPPGEEWIHPDPVVFCEREVAMYERALERLLSRPVWDREWYWGEEVASVDARLAVLQDYARLCQAKRDGKTGIGSFEDRQRQLWRQAKGTRNTRPRH